LVQELRIKEWADDKKSLEESPPRIIATLILKGQKEHAETLERERKQAEREEREREYTGRWKHGRSKI
jgi:hypothetical protein